jgi:hypothetical protein
VPYFEAFTSAKNPHAPETSEDQVVIVPGVAYAVIDGATDISGKRWNDVLGRGATGGRLAATAIAQALRDFAAAPFVELPTPEQVFAPLTAAVAALYQRLGILEDARRHSDVRFRATLAVALVAGNRLRLVRAGDSGFRVNGEVQLEPDFPAETALVTVRSQAWHLLAGRGVPVEERRQKARQLIVEGLDEGGLAIGLSAAEIAVVTNESVMHPRVVAAFKGDPEAALSIMRQGLKGQRKAPGEHTASVIDGIGDPSSVAAVKDFDLDAIETLEIFSDGYPAMPGEASIAAWESALANADSTDPERVDEFPATKGKVGDHFGDDRSIIIVKREPGPKA